VGELIYKERLTMNSRAWGLCLLSLIVTVLVVHPLFVVVTASAWLFNALYYQGLEVRIDDDLIWVGAKSAPLAALDLSTFDRASNTWPWKALSKDWLGANPIWTRDSVSVRGELDGRNVRVNVGTDHRDQLVAALTNGVHRARAQQQLGSPGRPDAPRPGWYVDPWNPVAGIRWWDGLRWTPHSAMRQPSKRGGR
jgi:hypothetical protein